MPIVGRLDFHRKQLTFDYLDTVTGQVTRGQVAPADKTDARHLRQLPAEDRLPECWVPPAHVLECRAPSSSCPRPPSITRLPPEGTGDRSRLKHSPERLPCDPPRCR